MSSFTLRGSLQDTRYLCSSHMLSLFFCLALERYETAGSTATVFCWISSFSFCNSDSCVRCMVSFIMKDILLLHVTYITEIRGLEVVWDQSNFQLVLVGSSLPLLCPTSGPSFFLDFIPSWHQAQHQTQKQKPCTNYSTSFHNCVKSNPCNILCHSQWYCFSDQILLYLYILTIFENPSCQ